MVLFDLPVATKSERREASQFREHLRDLGFYMVQFSVYMKHCSGKDRFNSILNKVKSRVPPHGNVRILQLTDKQYENIHSFGGRKSEFIHKDQFLLF